MKCFNDYRFGIVENETNVRNIVANNVHVSKFIGMVFDDGEMISMDTILHRVLNKTKF